MVCSNFSRLRPEGSGSGLSATCPAAPGPARDTRGIRIVGRKRAGALRAPGWARSISRNNFLACSLIVLIRLSPMNVHQTHPHDRRPSQVWRGSDHRVWRMWRGQDARRVRRCEAWRRGKLGNAGEAAQMRSMRREECKDGDPSTVATSLGTKGPSIGGEDVQPLHSDQERG